MINTRCACLSETVSAADTQFENNASQLMNSLTKRLEVKARTSGKDILYQLKTLLLA